jgi:hypothetical protein
MLPQGFSYEHTDIPPELTITEYRRARSPHRRGPRPRLRRPRVR